MFWNTRSAYQIVWMTVIVVVDVDSIYTQV